MRREGAKAVRLISNGQNAQYFHRGGVALSDLAISYSDHFAGITVPAYGATGQRNSTCVSSMWRRKAEGHGWGLPVLDR